MIAPRTYGVGQIMNVDFDSEQVRDLEALLSMARAQKKLKRYSDSVQYYQLAFEMKPLVSTLVEWAQVFIVENRNAEALQLYFRQMAQCRGQTSALFEIYKNIGNLYLNLNDVDAAEENYLKAFALNPLSDALMVNIATLELKRGDLDQAKDRFRQSLKLNRQNAKAWLGLSLVHQQHGDSDLAWANLKESLSIDSTEITTLQLLVEWAYRDGRLPLACDIFSSSNSIKPMTPTWRLVHAQMLFDLGAFEHAQNILKELPFDKTGVAELEKEIAKKIKGSQP